MLVKKTDFITDIVIMNIVNRDIVITNIVIINIVIININDDAHKSPHISFANVGHRP